MLSTNIMQDPTLDPNLKLQQQRTAAASSGSPAPAAPSATGNLLAARPSSRMDGFDVTKMTTVPSGPGSPPPPSGNASSGPGSPPPPPPTQPPAPASASGIAGAPTSGGLHSLAAFAASQPVGTSFLHGIQKKVAELRQAGIAKGLGSGPTDVHPSNPTTTWITPANGNGSGGSSGPGSPPAPGGAQNPNGPYAPGDVAIGKTILPNADDRLSKIQGLVDQTAGNLAGVDRTKLAQSMFDTFAKSSDPAYQAALRDANRAAFANGQGGSGKLRTSIGDLASNRMLALDTAKKNFMDEALNGSIADQFNKANTLAGLEGQQFGEGADVRNELRGERGYQGSLEQQAFERAMAQYQAKRQAQQDQFNQGVTLTQLGEEGNPANYYENMAAQGLLSADQLGQMLAGLGQQMGSRSGSPQQTPSYPPPPVVPYAPDNTLPAGTAQG